MGPFEKEEEGTGITSDVVQLKYPQLSKKVSVHPHMKLSQQVTYTHTHTLQAPPNLHPFVLEGLVHTKTFFTWLLGVAYSASKSESSSVQKFAITTITDIDLFKSIFSFGKKSQSIHSIYCDFLRFWRFFCDFSLGNHIRHREKTEEDCKDDDDCFYYYKK